MKKNKKSSRFGRYKRFALLFFTIIFILGFIIPQHLKMPVKGATSADYHPDSFWYYPWGKSVTHKGVDIFAPLGTPVKSATRGIVLYNGHLSMGGEVVVVLGPKWRLHYYAHLKYRSVETFSLVSPTREIGAVGNSGNAKGKPAHLHYSIVSLVPLPWRIDQARQGWLKMFYLNPIDYF